MIDPSLNVLLAWAIAYPIQREFWFGSWNIKEKKNFGSAYGTVSIAYRHKPNDKLSLFIDTFFDPWLRL